MARRALLAGKQYAIKANGDGYDVEFTARFVGVELEETGDFVGLLFDNGVRMYTFGANGGAEFSVREVRGR